MFYRTIDVARVMQVPVSRLVNWLNRGAAVRHAVSGPSGTSTQWKISTSGALTLAILARISGLGIDTQCFVEAARESAQKCAQGEGDLMVLSAPDVQLIIDVANIKHFLLKGLMELDRQAKVEAE